MRNPNTVFTPKLEATYYQECFNNPTYMEKRYNITIDVENLTPYQYFEYCARMFKTSINTLKKVKERDKGIDYIKDLEEIINDPSNQFPMVYIDFPSHNQEGLHRMYALGELYGWSNVRFPVLVITRTKKQEKEIEKEETERTVWNILQDVMYKKYLSDEEFIQELKIQINQEYGRNMNPEIKYIDETVSVKIDGFLFEYDGIKLKYETREDRDKNFDKWLQEFNEKYGE